MYFVIEKTSYEQDHNITTAIVSNYFKEETVIIGSNKCGNISYNDFENKKMRKRDTIIKTGKEKYVLFGECAVINIHKFTDLETAKLFKEMIEK